MLTRIPISGPDQKWELLDHFDPFKDTWVVSDLTSKFEIQRRLLENYSMIPSDAVLRVSELWDQLLRRTRPDLQVVSNEWILTLLRRYLKNHDSTWARQVNSSRTVFQYIQQLIPVFSHPHGRELMPQWFAERAASRMRWAHWYELAQECMDYLLKQGFIAPSWISGLLVNEMHIQEVWSRPLIVDLVVEISGTEIDVLHLISQTVPIRLVEPCPDGELAEHPALENYQLFGDQSKLPDALKTKSVGAPEIEVLRLPSQLGEIKQTVARIHQDLREGVPASEIAIAAPDIESYWFALHPFLKQEGIPCQKSFSSNYQSHPGFQQWFARLRVRSGKVHESDLELSLFRDDGYCLSFEEFRRLFTHIFTDEDLKRHPVVFKQFRAEKKATEILRRDEFIAWALSYWDRGFDASTVELVLARLYSECPEYFELPVENWIEYLEESCVRFDIALEKGDARGVLCQNLSSIEKGRFRRLYILGLTQKNLVSERKSALLHPDVESLRARYGFHLEFPASQRLEFMLLWILRKGVEKITLSYAEADFQGQYQAPSWVWLDHSFRTQQGETSKIPDATVWDQVQTLNWPLLGRFRGWSETRPQAFQEEWSLIHEKSGSPHFPPIRLSLSASGLEDYLKCPFVFAAKRLFHLSDLPCLDLDVDAQTQGKLMHKLFEQLLEDESRLSELQSELSELLDSCRQQVGLQVMDEALWNHLKQKYLRIAENFIQAELDYRKKFPAKTVGRELAVQGFIDPESGELKAEVEEGTQAIPFRGSIDRVDEDPHGNWVIIDYKSSGGKLTNYQKWMEHGNLQLALYVQAIEAGLTKLKGGHVVGANYYVPRPFQRHKGYVLSDRDQELIDLKGSRNKVTSKELNKLFDEMRTQIREVIQKLIQGQFPATPKKQDDCKNCEWKKLCRAPHL